MCIAIFSPGNSLTIEYISEAVSLSRDSSTHIIIDALICNSSANPIEKLCLLYPTSLHKKGQYISDYTYSMVKESLPVNSFYDIAKELVEDHKHVSHEKQNILKTIYVPEKNFNDRVKNKFRKLTGKIPKHYYNSDDFEKKLDKANITGENNSWGNFCNCTFIKFDCATPIKEGAGRWLRLKINTGSWLRDDIPLTDKILRFLLKRLKYYYTFMGPQDVVDVIAERTNAAIQFYSRKKDKFSQEALKHIISMNDEIFVNGFNSNNTQTIIKDFRLNIFTGESGRPESVNWYGNVSVLNNLPNYYYDKLYGGYKAVFQWVKDDFILSKTSNKESRFRITMRTSPLTLLRILFDFFICFGALLGFLSFYLKL